MKLPKTVSDATRRRNPALFGHSAAASPSIPKLAQTTNLEIPNLLPVVANTDEAKLNKTEAEYLMYIRCLGFAWIGVQNITLKLGHDCRYTPDFVTVDKNGHLDVREVKGFFRDDAKVKIKVAARMFPWMTFQVVRKAKTGWEHQIVKP